MGETIAVKWFAFDEIPTPLSIGQRRKIEDAIAGRSGLAVLQESNLSSFPEGFTRQQLYEQRDRSGLSRQAFYLQMIEDMQVRESIEVGRE